MPIKQSAKKALRQAKKRTAANKIVKDASKLAIKNVLKAIESGKDVQDAIKAAQKKLGKAAKKGVIKKQTAARKLSRLMKKINTAIKK